MCGVVSRDRRQVDDFSSVVERELLQRCAVILRDLFLLRSHFCLSQRCVCVFFESGTKSRVALGEQFKRLVSRRSSTAFVGEIWQGKRECKREREPTKRATVAPGKHQQWGWLCGREGRERAHCVVYCEKLRHLGQRPAATMSQHKGTQSGQLHHPRLCFFTARENRAIRSNPFVVFRIVPRWWLVVWRWTEGAQAVAKWQR